MYTLYTTNTCPKGVAAQAFLEGKKVPFTLMNIDTANRKIEYTSFPTLTKQDQGREFIVLTGFDPVLWEQQL